jgi:hypothetical protein
MIHGVATGLVGSTDTEPKPRPVAGKPVTPQPTGGTPVKDKNQVSGHQKTVNVRTFDFSAGLSGGVTAVADDKREAVTIGKTGPLPKTGTVATEDGSFDPDAYEMGYDPQDPARGLILDMAAVGEQEGFTLAIHTTAAGLPQLQKELDGMVASGRITQAYRDSITIVTGNGDSGNAWTQDNGEIRGNVMMVPPKLEEDDIAGGEGEVSRGDHRQQKIQLAASLGLEVKEMKTYLEGGNVLAGKRPDGQRFAIVGQDSVDTSRNLLERTLGRKVSEAEVKKAIAEDLGIDPKQVVFAAQPSSYHMDMAMTVMGGNEVMLNDPVAAAKTEAQWRREDHAKLEPPKGSPEHAAWEKQGAEMEADIADQLSVAEAKSEGVAKTAADLQKAGFTVKKVAGVFPHYQMNFMNSVQLTNPKGERVAVMLGGDSRGQDLIKAQYAKYGVTQVHFTDPAYTAPTLSAYGGIRCRTKEVGGHDAVPAK